MKILIFFLLLVSFINADEIKRIESIVEDITKLRVKYKECQSSLQTKLDEDNKDSEKIIENLKNQIIKYEKLLKTKDEIIIALKAKKAKENMQKSTKKQICKPIKIDKPNKFPKLILKDVYAKENIIKTKPSTYRLKNNAFIYDKIDGNKIEEWESQTSFTSNVRSDSWVKITGFFVNREWVRSNSNMWVKLKDVRKR